MTARPVNPKCGLANIESFPCSEFFRQRSGFRDRPNRFLLVRLIPREMNQEMNQAQNKEKKEESPIKTYS
jgi:hypothetical protein